MVSLDPVIDKIFEEALACGASDIHLEPHPEGLALRFRVNGHMQDWPTISATLKDSIPAKLKLMARLDPAQSLVPQDGAFVLQGVQVRLSALPVVGGQSLVLRLFKNHEKLQNLLGLGLSKAQKNDIEEAVRQMQGLLIIAGPTGSGKTTTFYAALRALDPVGQKIVTVEDPVEQRLSGVCQVPVRGALNFSAALRSILRQAPNVIGVGELRDLPSVQMAVQAALTGHLVVATLHADSAAAVPVRLMDMGVEPAVLSEVLTCVVAQRLIHYKKPGAQHAACGVFEVWRPAKEQRDLIRRRASAEEILKSMNAGGFVALAQQAQAWVEAGELTAESILGEFV